MITNEKSHANHTGNQVHEPKSPEHLQPASPSYKIINPECQQSESPSYKPIGQEYPTNSTYINEWESE